MSISALNESNRTKRPPIVRTVGGISPDWNNIPHSGMTSLNKEEIKDKVRELAAQVPKATNQKEKDEIARQVKYLFNQYVSSDSPDRKTLYANAVQTIKQQAGGGNKNSSNIDCSKKTLFDYLKQQDSNQKGMEFDKAYSFSGGGAVTATQAMGGGANYNITLMGKNVLSIDSDGSVAFWPTPAEIQLRNEIGSIYIAARENSKGMPASDQTADSGINITV